MPTNNIETTISLQHHLENDCDGEAELVPYMLKIKLLESGIPVIIDPLSIRSNVINVKHGKLKAIITHTHYGVPIFHFVWTKE